MTEPKRITKNKIWYLYCILDYIMQPFSFLLAPFIVWFAYPQEGYSNNGSEWKLEPRLPKLLSGFQTPDNSLYGDYGWQNIHCPENWNNWKGMIGWLWRNRLHGFAWNTFGVIVEEPVTYTGVFAPSQNPVNLGTMRCKCGDAWEFKKVAKIPGTNYAVIFHYGWLLHPYVSGPLPWYNKRAKFKATVKFGSMG